MKRTAVAACAFVLGLLFVVGAASAQTAPGPRLVLGGHDPVAYFTESRPVKGDPAFSYDWDGGRYHFASARNRDAFAANPDQYAPRFGGFCTGSLSRGKYNEVDPQAWIISDGKLYLFGQMKFKRLAETDPSYLPTRVAAATQHWNARK